MPRNKLLLLLIPLAAVLLAALAWWTPWQPRRTLVAIVSEQNAATLAEAGRAFHQQHPRLRLRFRTTAQVEAMTDAQLAQLFDGADAVFLATVFNDNARRLLPLLGEHGPANVLAVSSAPELGMASRWQGRRLFADADPRYRQLSSAESDTASDAAWVARASAAHPTLAPWIHARGYWQNRNAANLAALFAELAGQRPLPKVQDIAAIRVRHGGDWQPLAQYHPQAGERVVAILDHERADPAGDLAVIDALCQALARRQLRCLPVLARWGSASSQALALLRQKLQGDGAPGQLAAIVSLQDFVIGGSSDRQAASQALAQLGVPVLKGIRLHDMEQAAWHLSEQGIARDSVYYRIAMPELQGIGQPLVIAAAQPPQADPLTGIEVAQVQPLSAQIEHLARRAGNWARLQSLPNADKRVAIVYYNHPPGRHNIGADNLDVPASLLRILRELKTAGYDTGALPDTPAALLERLQHDGINLPEQGDALSEMATRVQTMPAADYARWFATLPPGIRDEMQGGALALLRDDVQAALAARHPELAQTRVERTLRELRHILEGTRHPARERALALFGQLQQRYQAGIAAGHVDADALARLDAALAATGIEGMRGWGAPPGRIMVAGERLVLPGLRFGKVFVGPQPPRGWELNEELLHANTSLPPTHQYLAFYHWLHDEFRADAVIHLGRHSTYEFLPRKSIGLDEDDYPALIAGDVPGIYPYIVDGVGEGLQAKRRGLAVMIDHLTPPLSTTPLYDKLLRLRQLVESYEAASDPGTRAQAVQAMRALIDELHLRAALVASMDEELKLRGVSFEQADDEFLVHEIGHYLTKLQEDFMPLGLHVFGQDWDEQALRTMLTSMGASADAKARAALAASPAAERGALL
ncbi:MAG: cobaltochelatase subunit CobN, partial [Pseudomonas sp.]